MDVIEPPLVSGAGAELIPDPVPELRPPPPPPGPRRWMPPALRVRAFRWFWAAQWPTLLGTWMQLVALGYLVFAQTHSVTAVAVVAAADGFPAVALSLAGGLVADRLPRRRILLVTQSLLGVSSGALAVLAATGHASLAAIIVVAFVFGASDAVDLPTRQALVADLVERRDVLNAMALGSAAMSTTRIIGPSVAGLLIQLGHGPALCFAALSAAYLVPIIVLLRVIPDIPPLPRPENRSLLSDLFAGVASAARDPLLRGVLLAGGVLALLGVSYMPYLPVLSAGPLHGSAGTLGLMYSVGGVGGLIGGLLLGIYGRGGGRRWLLFGGGCLYAVSLFTVAHSQSLALTLPALVGISLAFVAINTSLTTVLQTEGDARIRGRLLGLYATLFAGLQPAGTLAYGALDRAVGLFNAIGAGAIIVGGVAVVVAMSPAMRRMR
jgi:MFS family permease